MKFRKELLWQNDTKADFFRIYEQICYVVTILHWNVYVKTL